jgi:hypothetical protein
VKDAGADADADSSRTWEVGETVNVLSRTGPGVNKPGGVGRISAKNADGTYNVKYVMCGRETHVSAKHIVRESGEASPAKKKKAPKKGKGPAKIGAGSQGELDLGSLTTSLDDYIRILQKRLDANMRTFRSTAEHLTEQVTSAVQHENPSNKRAARSAAGAERGKTFGGNTIGGSTGPLSCKPDSWEVISSEDEYGDENELEGVALHQCTGGRAAAAALVAATNAVGAAAVISATIDRVVRPALISIRHLIARGEWVPSAVVELDL